jgi:heme/copper-type cytochrome/quinol oxidase subunit 2
MQLLILLVVIVGIVAIGQLAKVYELSSRISGRREEDISHADTRLNANLFLVFVIGFFASTAYLYWAYGDYAPPAASVHGVALDTLMSFNIWIITAVFVLVNFLLFYFAWKYAYDKNRKATFFAHDNRLELIWTVIPSIVLAVIIIYGLRTWNVMTGDAAADALRIEVYSKQFDWTVRYPGNDGEFGQSNYNLITPMNPLGILTSEGVEDAIVEIEKQIGDLEHDLAMEKGLLIKERDVLTASIAEDDHGHGGHGDHGHDDHADHVDHGHDDHADHGDHGHDDHADHGDHGHDDHADHGDHGNDDHADHGHGEHGWKDVAEARIAAIDHLLNHQTDRLLILTDAQIEAKEDKLKRLKRHRQRIMEIEGFTFENGLNSFDTGRDDQVVKGEFHIPVGQEVEFVFRSRDVIHSAFMPHFRAQMNTVPGVPTRFKMTPIITTDSMRVILDDPDFNYVLLCNKVCGAAHFNMKMDLIVESQEEYDAWLEQQDAFLVDEEAPSTPDSEPTPSADVELTDGGEMAMIH